NYGSLVRPLIRWSLRLVVTILPGGWSALERVYSYCSSLILSLLSVFNIVSSAVSQSMSEPPAPVAGSVEERPVSDAVVSSGSLCGSGSRRTCCESSDCGREDNVGRSPDGPAPCEGVH